MAQCKQLCAVLLLLLMCLPEPFASGFVPSVVLPSSTISVRPRRSSTTSLASSVRVDILESFPGNARLTTSSSYDSMVTLSVSNPDGSLPPSAVWSTRLEHKGDGLPFTFQPGKNLIAGWTDGVLQMNEGERAMIHVPYSLGYGEHAQGSKGGGGWYIPGKSNLVFDIEIRGKTGAKGPATRDPSDDLSSSAADFSSSTLYSPTFTGPSPSWDHPVMVSHACRLIASYHRLTGSSLVPLSHLSDPYLAARTLYHLPSRVVVSHGVQSSPVLNYGNGLALDRWRSSWGQLTSMPSRLTAEPDEREGRERFLAAVLKNGLVKDYVGVRIDREKGRFKMLDGAVWNVQMPDEFQGERIGQAATFSKWIDL